MTPYEFIEAEKANYSVSELCSALAVSRSGYSKWRTASPSRRARDDERLTAHVRAIHQRSRRTYGSPRVHASQAPTQQLLAETSAATCTTAAFLGHQAGNLPRNSG